MQKKQPKQPVGMLASLFKVKPQKASKTTSKTKKK
jgi:hypothetical protein